MDRLSDIADKIDSYFSNWDSVDEVGCFPSNPKGTVFDDFVKLADLYSEMLLLFGAVSIIPILFISIIVKDYTVLQFGTIGFLVMFFVPIAVRFVMFLVCIALRLPHNILKRLGLANEL